MLIDHLSNKLTYPAARRESVIDSLVLPLADFLYENGANPLASCAGSWDKRVFFAKRTLIKYPYIMFSSDTRLAQQIEKVIQSNKTNCLWLLSSHFIDGDQVWSISSEGIREGGDDTALSQSDIESDFSNMTEYLKAAFDGGRQTRLRKIS